MKIVLKSMVLALFGTCLINCGGSSSSGPTDQQGTPPPSPTPSSTPTSTATPTSTPTSPPTSTPTSTPTTTPTPTPDGSSTLVLDSWLMNTNSEVAMYVGASSILVNVTSVTESTVNNTDYARVVTSGIPNYQMQITQELIDAINARPRADLANDSQQDLVSGSVTVSAGDVIQFGEDIGYRSFSMESTCGTDEGYGYWPPGPTCPEDQAKQGLFPITPVASSSDCDTGLSAVGYAINGTSIYNWNDGQSYNSQGVWQTLAPAAEQYDVDICGGHAANGDYHHHFYSSCWATAAGETATGHSPVYGFAADGYAVYGPWHDTGVLAQSCWKVRDYSAASATGCGVEGERSCLLVDEYNPLSGTVSASSNGPTTSGTYTSLSQNSFDTVAGFFRQDYYFDSSCTSEAANNLDEYNGHDHDDLGYHYHVTLQAKAGDGVFPFAIDDGYEPAFPFTFGPRYRGEISADAIASCSGNGGPPGGPPPP